MEQKNQVKNPLLDLIIEEMSKKDMIPERLIELSGVPKTSVTRVLKGSKQVSIKNIYKILNALNLLNVGQNKIEIKLPVKYQYIQTIIDAVNQNKPGLVKLLLRYYADEEDELEKSQKT